MAFQADPFAQPGKLIQRAYGSVPGDIDVEGDLKVQGDLILLGDVSMISGKFVNYEDASIFTHSDPILYINQELAPTALILPVHSVGTFPSLMGAGFVISRGEDAPAVIEYHDTGTVGARGEGYFKMGILGAEKTVVRVNAIPSDEEVLIWSVTDKAAKAGSGLFLRPLAGTMTSSTLSPQFTIPLGGAPYYKISSSSDDLEIRWSNDAPKLGFGVANGTLDGATLSTLGTIKSTSQVLFTTNNTGVLIDNKIYFDTSGTSGVIRSASTSLPLTVGSLTQELSVVGTPLNLTGAKLLSTLDANGQTISNIGSLSSKGVAGRYLTYNASDYSPLLPATFVGTTLTNSDTSQTYSVTSIAASTTIRSIELKITWEVTVVSPSGLTKLQIPFRIRTESDLEVVRSVSGMLYFRHPSNVETNVGFPITAESMKIVKAADTTAAVKYAEVPSSPLFASTAEKELHLVLILSVGTPVLGFYTAYVTVTHKALGTDA
jgi:hypothetical protein